MNLTRWRVMDRHRARAREATHLTADNQDGESNEAGNRSVEQLPDLKDLNDEAAETEWKESLMAAALERLGRRVPAKHFQVFDLYSRRQWPVLRVARELGVNPATVYVISHRMTKELRAEIERLQRQLA